MAEMKEPLSALELYSRTILFSIFIFALAYGYNLFLKSDNPASLAIADVSIILISFSMMLSGLCYFWNRFDKHIVYRKYLGLIGFVFAIAHVVIFRNAFFRLFTIQAWEAGRVKPALTGTIAFTIFLIMAMISNEFSAKHLGGKLWRSILRVGYLGITFIWLHVFFLESKSILAWFQEGVKTPPTSGAILLIIMIFVLLLRVALGISLLKKRGTQALYTPETFK